MQKPLFPISFFLLLCCTSQAQQNNATLSVTIGPSFPMGNYGKKDASNAASGFASVGEVVQVSYAWFYNDRFGLAATLHGQRNHLNTAALERSYAQANLSQGVYIGSSPGQQPSQTPGAIYPHWMFEKSAWRLGSVLLGGVAQSSSKHTIQFAAKAMLGVAYAASPRLSGQSITDTATGFAYTFGCGIRQALTKRVQLVADVDYFGTANLTFKDITARLTTTKNVNELSVQQRIITGSMRQRVGAVNVQVGIGIRL